MGLMKSGDVKDLKSNTENVRKIVEETLKKTPNRWYTIMGMMVLKFGVEESDILGIPWSKMDKEHALLYNRIKRVYKALLKENKVNEQKHGKAMVYWWKI